MNIEKKCAGQTYGTQNIRQGIHAFLQGRSGINAGRAIIRNLFRRGYCVSVLDSNQLKYKHRR